MDDFTREWFDEGCEANRHGKQRVAPEHYRATALQTWLAGWDWNNLMRGLGALPVNANTPG